MKYYDSIDNLPIYNWFKCIDTNDYTFLLVDKNKPIKEPLDAVFEVIYYEYIDAFGISDYLLDIIELQNEISLLEIDKVLEKDNSLQAIIDIKKFELSKKTNIEKTKTKSYKSTIEKYLGFRLNEKEVTVKEYYEYLNEIKENGRATD